MYKTNWSKPLTGWFMSNIALIARQLCGFCLLYLRFVSSSLFCSSLALKLEPVGISFSRSSKVTGQQKKRASAGKMLTRLMSFNLSEARLKFNSCPSPNASQCVCSPAVCRWVVSSWAQVFSLCLGLTLFMPEGHQELQTTEFFIKVTSWRDVPCSCCSLP